MAATFRRRIRRRPFESLTIGGRHIRILNSTFAQITGTSGARLGVITVDPLPQQRSYDFDDLVVSNCAFRNNSGAAVYFYPAASAYRVRRFRFLGNSVRHPAGGGFVAGSSARLEDLVLEHNHFDLARNAWAVPSRSTSSVCLPVIARSINNTWIDNAGSSKPKSAEVLGLDRGTVACNVVGLVDQATLAIPPRAQLLTVAGRTGAVTVKLSTGKRSGQRIVLVGSSDARTVTLLDGGTVNLGARRTLGAGDCLELVWAGRLGRWCELSYRDN